MMAWTRRGNGSLAGFTLLELLVVIGIVSLLAALVSTTDLGPCPTLAPACMLLNPNGANS